MRYVFGTLALVALGACTTTVPDSAAGVGFGDYSAYQRELAAREAELNGQALPSASAVSSETLSPAGAPNSTEAERLASDTTAALNSGDAPLNASPSNPAPEVALNAAGISDENDFGNVSSLRSIEGDKARIEQNRAQYQVVTPTALPSRNGAEGPNIVAYALQTRHSVGQPVYKRLFAASEKRALRNCAAYASDDQAQTAFLAKGGPERDRLGLDPDGDGYACRWDPTPFRAYSGG
ncbi:hypothetical protein MHM86_12045 [Thalassobius sp. Cn5-15]|nr:hypothetical protein [Thalassobius sp. Cn5-15]MCG7494283.1 hypothetical protein [Thalassobius sp. Cn5-15]